MILKQLFQRRSALTKLTFSSKTYLKARCQLSSSVIKKDEEETDNEKMSTISIDTSGLLRVRDDPKPVPAATKININREPETDLIKHLKTKILMGGGPITVAEYMKEVLTNPKSGFYMKSEVFGSEGDFVTSPEISQMFGELIGIWCVYTWEQMGKPEKFKLVELGPGRGTLIADLMRATKTMDSVHLVEVSHQLRKVQSKTLQCGIVESNSDRDHSISSITKCEVFWHQSLDNIPKKIPEIIIAHEFLDSLPVHHFIKTKYGWRERLIDVAPPDHPLHFRFVVSPSQTPASLLLTQKRLSWIDLLERDKINEIEISGEMLALAIKLSERVSETKGISLIIDYGKDSFYTGSLQAIRKHEFVDVLQDPGTADLSAYVDFSALRRAVEESRSKAIALGPIEQRCFLKHLGIDARLEILIRNASIDQGKALQSGYLRLVGSEETGQSDGMGKIYKVMTIAHKNLPVPLGFE